MSAETQFLEMIGTGRAVHPDKLFPLYDALAPLAIEDLFGTWRGGKFDGGATPDPIRWYGKRFVSADHCEPLLCSREDGTVYAYDQLGAAQLRLMAWRGTVSAGLIYDKQPIMDYFRKVTDDVIVGLGDVKGRPTDFFFHLTRT